MLVQESFPDLPDGQAGLSGEHCHDRVVQPVQGVSAVLTLVAAGRSNRQIAQALFISPKTASVHVSNILAKLGAATRVEAAAPPTAAALTDAGQRRAVIDAGRPL